MAVHCLEGVDQAAAVPHDDHRLHGVEGDVIEGGLLARHNSLHGRVDITSQFT